MHKKILNFVLFFIFLFLITGFTNTVFADTFLKKVDFNGASDGGVPAYLTFGDNGKLYGTTSSGGLNSLGVIFEWDPGTNTYIKKYDFSNANGDNSYGALTLSGGKFYGMTSLGGANNLGVIFEWDPGTNTYIKKHDFDGINGSSPYGSLTLNEGKFYGMTNSGGANNLGVIFEWDPGTNTYIKKFDFSGINGSNPQGFLVLNGGKFYGMTQYGGSNSLGVIFEWDPGTNTYVKKYDFVESDGSNPFGSLTLKDNKFYGVTNNGGLNQGRGVIFEWDPVTNTYIKKIDLEQDSGSYPTAGSLTLSGGRFYGTASSGGITDGGCGCGVIFEWDPVENVYTTKYNFDDINGYGPKMALVLGADRLYGVTPEGGVDGFGVIFEYTSPYTTGESDITIPIVETTDATSVRKYSARLNGNISSAGGEDITARGFEYGLDTDYGEIIEEEGTFTTGLYSKNISSIDCRKTYHFRAYAINSEGPGYGEDKTFRTEGCSGHIIGSSASALSLINIPKTETSIPKQETTNDLINTPSNSNQATVIGILFPKLMGSSVGQILKNGITDQSVLELQKYLNSNGYSVSLKGSGSPGHETNYFGPLTRLALMKFQKENKLVVDGVFGKNTHLAIIRSLKTDTIDTSVTVSPDAGTTSGTNSGNTGTNPPPVTPEVPEVIPETIVPIIPKPPVR